MSHNPKYRLFLATPCYGGMVTQIYMQSVLGLITESRTAISVGLLGQDALITRSRNTLVAQFRKTDSTHILFVDADIGFVAADVHRLLDVQKDVIGSMYPLRTFRWTRSSLDRVKEGESVTSAGLDYVGELLETPDDAGYARGRYAGTGFLLVSRQAIEQLVEQYPELKCTHQHVSGGTPDLEVFALFDCLIDPRTRHYLSEDYAFCWRWRAIGGEVWLDTRSKLTHCGMSEFVGDPGLRFADVKTS